MKKSILFILIAGLFWACDKDESAAVHVQPVKAGDEILFAGSLSNGTQSKTEYGDLAVDAQTGKNFFPVYWVTGDEIVVSCPEAYFPAHPTASPHQRIAKYSITANEGNNRETAAFITKSSENVLQWSDAQIHHFYSVYPASAVQSADEQGFVSTVSENQLSQKVVETQNPSGLGVTKTVVPNMSNAFMVASSTYDKNHPTADGKVNLPFKPLSTVLEVTIHGPEEVNTEVVNISKVTVSSVSGKSICGKYKIFIDSQGQISGSEPIEAGVVNNTITASTTTDKGVELRKGDKAVYKIFLAPDVNEDDVLVVSIGTQFGTLKKTLNKTHIQPQKVNRVTLPQIKRSATNNNWISDLDPNIYITELSYPGSKMSVLVNRYQTYGIAHQMNEGIRAFIIQTSVKTVGRDQALVVAGDTGAIKYEGNYVQVKDAVKPIANYLAANPNEFGFVMFTFRSKTSEDTRRLSVSQNWMRVLMQTCNEMSADPSYRIYTPQVGPNTTISDVAGKILLKANYNDNTMFAQRLEYPEAPLMLSIWEYAYPQDQPETPEGVPLYWGNNASADMKWFYQEVTTVSETGTDAEASYEQKMTYMKNVFEKSVALYLDSQSLHDIWFVNDLGGQMVDASGPETGEQALAKWLHPEASTILRQRQQNAALGLIFMNFADRQPDSGQLYGSDWLIQTVIDNNFKFALRKKAGVQPAPASTKVPVAAEDEWD